MACVHRKAFSRGRYLNASGLMWETAPQMNAMLVFAEHRYYGAPLANFTVLICVCIHLNLIRTPVPAMYKFRYRSRYGDLYIQLAFRHCKAT